MIKETIKKIITKYLFYNIGIFHQVLFKSNSTIKKEKNLIQEKANKLSSVSKFRINIL